MGRLSRKNINIPSTDLILTTVASNTKYDENMEKLFDFDNIIAPQDVVNSPKNRSLLLQLKQPEMKIYWEDSPSQHDGSEIQKGVQPTASKNKTYNTQHFEEHSPFDLRDDKSSFAEDRHSEDDARNNVIAPGRGSIVHAPPRQHDMTPRPAVWTSVHHPRAPFITFWPVGILMMAVFIVGFVSLVLCRVMATSRPTYSRRTIRLSRPALSPRSTASDDGGFGDRSRRRADIPASSGSNPPRAATPPPPYPGSPPGATVYVNPLDTKTCHLSVPSVLPSLRRNCNTSPTPGDLELPPPYPGTWIANTNPELPQHTNATTQSDPTHSDSTNSASTSPIQSTVKDSSVAPDPPKRASSNRGVSSTTRIHTSPSAELKTGQVTTPVTIIVLNTDSNSNIN